MFPKNIGNVPLKIGIILIELIWLAQSRPNLNSDLPSPSNEPVNELQLLPLGNSVKLGTLYNVHTQRFQNESIFSYMEPTDDLTQIVTPDPKQQIAEGLIVALVPSDKFHLLGMSVRQALGVEIGQIKTDPSTQFLNSEDSPDSGQFEYRLKAKWTRAERLNLNHENSPYKIDFTKFRETNATHVLIEIEWGARVISKMPMPKKNQSQNPPEAQMFTDLDITPILISESRSDPVKFTTTELPESTTLLLDENISTTQPDFETTTVTAMQVPDMEILEDSKEPPKLTSSNLLKPKEVDEVMSKFPDLVGAENKGTPMRYILWPVEDILAMFTDPGEVSSLGTKKSLENDDPGMIEGLQIHDRIFLVYRDLGQLQQKMKSHSHIFKHDDLERIQILKRNFVKVTTKLKNDIRSILESKGDLEKVLSEYYINPYGYPQVNQSLHRDFKHVTEKLKFYDWVQKQGISYLGRDSSFKNIQLMAQIGNHKNDLTEMIGTKIYALYFKDLSTIFSSLKWLETRSRFFNLKTIMESTSLNKFVIDCNLAFEFETCEDLHQPVIHEYEILLNGSLALSSIDFPNGGPTNSKNQESDLVHDIFKGVIKDFDDIQDKLDLKLQNILKLTQGEETGVKHLLDAIYALQDEVDEVGKRINNYLTGSGNNTDQNGDYSYEDEEGVTESGSFELDRKIDMNTILDQSKQSRDPSTTDNLIGPNPPLLEIPEANKTCSIIFNQVSKTDKQLIINEHNRFRQFVAAGLEKRGSPGPQPGASNLKNLIWDDGLAKTAQKWIHQCQFEHDMPQNRKTRAFESVGQNLAWRFQSDRSALPVKSDWQSAISDWYEEVVDFNAGEVSSFQPRREPVVGHYTQVVAGATTHVGCGYVQYLTEKGVEQLYSCNYGPSGNYQGQPVYKIAKST